jgi:hypothetical protein
MRSKNLALILAALTVMMFAPSVRADVVHMKNGDRLTGEVVEKEGGTLRFRTGYAGTIGIKWDRIRSVETVESVLTILEDGTEVRTQKIIVGEEEIVAIRPVAPSTGTKGKLSGRTNVSLKFERGNTNKDDIGVDFEMEYRRGIRRFRLVGGLEQDRKDAENTKEEWLLWGSYDHFLTRKLYLAGWVHLKHDEFADLSLRTSVGPYVGYQFFERRSLNLLVEIGAIFVREEHDLEPDDTFWGPGWSINFEKYIFGDYLQAYHEQHGIINAERGDDWFWRSVTGLRVPLFGGLVGSAEVKLDYESEPSGGTDSTQATYGLKLGYAW